MTRLRRQAWLELAICAATAIAVFTLYLLLHDVRRSLAGFAVLSLVGLAHVTARGRPYVADERDAQTQRTATLTAYSVFWLCFVLWSVVVSLRFNTAGQVPIQAVEPAVWVGFWIVVAVRATAAVIVDARAS